jgi:hypothetical protein
MCVSVISPGVVTFQKRQGTNNSARDISHIHLSETESEVKTLLIIISQYHLFQDSFPFETPRRGASIFDFQDLPSVPKRLRICGVSDDNF